MEAQHDMEAKNETDIHNVATRAVGIGNDESEDEQVDEPDEGDGCRDRLIPRSNVD